VEKLDVAKETFIWLSQNKKLISILLLKILHQEMSGDGFLKSIEALYFM